MSYERNQDGKYHRCVAKGNNGGNYLTKNNYIFSSCEPSEYECLKMNHCPLNLANNNCNSIQPIGNNPMKNTEQGINCALSYQNSSDGTSNPCVAKGIDGNNWFSNKNLGNMFFSSCEPSSYNCRKNRFCPPNFSGSSGCESINKMVPGAGVLCALSHQINEDNTKSPCVALGNDNSHWEPGSNFSRCESSYTNCD